MVRFFQPSDPNASIFAERGILDTIARSGAAPIVAQAIAQAGERRRARQDATLEAFAALDPERQAQEIERLSALDDATFRRVTGFNKEAGLAALGQPREKTAREQTQQRREEAEATKVEAEVTQIAATTDLAKLEQSLKRFELQSRVNLEPFRIAAAAGELTAINLDNELKRQGVTEATVRAQIAEELGLKTARIDFDNAQLKRDLATLEKEALRQSIDGDRITQYKNLARATGITDVTRLENILNGTDTEFEFLSLPAEVEMELAAKAGFGDDIAAWRTAMVERFSSTTELNIAQAELMSGQATELTGDGLDAEARAAVVSAENTRMQTIINGTGGIPDPTTGAVIPKPLREYIASGEQHPTLGDRYPHTADEVADFVRDEMLKINSVLNDNDAAALEAFWLEVFTREAIRGLGQRGAAGDIEGASFFGGPSGILGAGNFGISSEAEANRFRALLRPDPSAPPDGE